MKIADIPIRTKLIFTCIIIGILPLAVVGFFGDRLASRSLLDKSFDKLVTIQSLRKKQVETSFKRLIDNLQTVTVSEGFMHLVTTLEQYRHQQDIPASSPFPVDTPAYQQMVGEFLDIYHDYIDTYGYYDFKLISSLTGQVMFTVAKERDLGANLIYGRYKESSLAMLWREVLNTGKTAVVDFSPNEPSDGMESLFLGQPVYNKGGTLMAVAVLQISPAYITSLIDSREGMGESGESYLIRWYKESEIFEFRSNMVSMGDGKYVVGYRLDNIPQYWWDAVRRNQGRGQGIYADSAGVEVLVTYDRLDLPLLEWYQISKIDKAEVLAPVNKLFMQGLALTAVLCLVIIGCAVIFSRRIVQPIIADVEFAKAISAGNLEASLSLDQKDELGVLARSLNEMASGLRRTDWLKRGKEGLDEQLRGVTDPKELGQRFITYLVNHLEAQLGVYYYYQDGTLDLVASHGFTDRSGNFNKIRLGEGLVGQAALERRLIVFSQVPDGVPEYNYTVSQQPPPFFLAAPLLFESEILGAFLVGSFTRFSNLHRQFIEENLESVAIFLNMAKSHQTIAVLYEKAQEQQDELLVVNKGLERRTRELKESEAELQAQQEELRVTNEELEERTEALQRSQDELQTQQEELRVTNEELQERTETLERQKAALRQKTADLVKAQKEIEKKAEELDRGSKYKSEFLANMSHELRTPLNSILILSQLLAANKSHNLDPRQIESAKAIHSSGSELLTLINEILDLSKVEAGKIELYFEEVQLATLVDKVRLMFKDLAVEKGLDFVIDISRDLPPTMFTDSQRVQQILRNLLTNAFKFTAQGQVSLTVSRPPANLATDESGQSAEMIAFAVKDQGIGIREQQREEIFKAFQQADGSTSRTYGGTGLGLSISKELTRLLGGSIHLQSEIDKGSTFTVVIPQHGKMQEDEKDTSVTPPRDKVTKEQGGTKEQRDTPPIDPPKNRPREADRDDDRHSIKAGEKSVLIIEDDHRFAGVLRDFAREYGFKCILADTGEKGLYLADYYRPSAIILDIGLPGIDGWEVMSRLKENPALRHIPVHFMSAADGSFDAMRLGAVGFLPKPVEVEGLNQAFAKLEKVISRPVRRLLVVENDKKQADSIRELIGSGDVDTTIVTTGGDALAAMKKDDYDCMILDLGLDDMTGFDLLDRMQQWEMAARVPVIVYTGRDLSRQEEERLRKYTESIIIKGVKSPERLLDESALFLHRVEENLPEKHRKATAKGQRNQSVFKGKTILVVDDDMRNVFALTHLLEEKEVEVVVARNGLESLQKLEQHRDIDLVLMDIMMPKMDGISAMQEIRKNARLAKLPIIALTAKAMKGDRAKCIDAGANDYLAKPVNTDKLLSMLKVWLY